VTGTHYRLRLTTGTTLTGATYGGDDYGDGTWGQAGTDPLDGIQYTLIPWPAGYPLGVGWEYHVGDEAPDWEATISSTSTPIDQSAITTAELILDRVSPGVAFKLVYDIENDEVDGLFRREWEADDLIPEAVGIYRASIRLVFTSARQLTVPAHDELMFRILPTSLEGLASGGWLE
jgi:hypothetical protein